MSSVKEDLIKARAKIEKGWCQGVAARDINGESVHATSSDAVQFCILGALGSVRGRISVEGTSWLYHAIHNGAPKLGGFTISAYNDAPWRTQEEVLAIFDKAIALAEEEE